MLALAFAATTHAWVLLRYLELQTKCRLWGTEQISEYEKAPPNAKLFVMAGVGAPDQERLLSEYAGRLPPPVVTSFHDVSVYATRPALRPDRSTTA